MKLLNLFVFALFVTARAASQDASKMFPYSVPDEGPNSPVMHSQCAFSDGKVISVTYSTRHVRLAPALPSEAQWGTVFNDIQFVADDRLNTAGGISVRAGSYAVAPAIHYPMVFMKLIIKDKNGGELRVPMTKTSLASPAANTEILFEHTGASCTMRINSKNSTAQFSVEFVEQNTVHPYGVATTLISFWSWQAAAVAWLATHRSI